MSDALRLCRVFALAGLAKPEPRLQDVKPLSARWGLGRRGEERLRLD